MPELQPITMQDVRILFRNFQGKEDRYNRAGDRNFSVELPADVAHQMSTDGWNVKPLRPREEGDEPGYHLPVEVSYKVRPPKVWLVSGRSRTEIKEPEVEMLDWMDFINIDVTLNPFAWGPNADGKFGIKAYLGALFVTIVEDPLEAKYSEFVKR